MLIRITNNCDMGCSHCMVDAQPDGAHMTREVFRRALAFSMSYDPMVLMISGGEPTRHPHFLEIVELLKRLPRKAIAILSNGSFVDNEEIYNALLESGLKVQIANDPRYYPKRTPSRVKKDFVFEDKLRSLVELGRAKENGMRGTRNSPMCFNLRSAVKSTRDLVMAIHTLRSKGYFCTPSINVDGTVTVGESPFCQVVGTVDDEEQRIIQNILWVRCDQCNTWNKLDSKVRKMFF